MSDAIKKAVEALESAKMFCPASGEITLALIEKAHVALKQLMENGGWRPITGEIHRKVLVTNNLYATTNCGDMSHVWVADMVHVSTDKADKGQFISFGDGFRKIWGLTHYCEIQPPPPPLNNEGEA